MLEWYHPRSANAIEPYPWLAKETISYLENLLQPDFEVIEFGGGGSTLWFAERVQYVMTYENNRKWFEKISELIPMTKVLLQLADKPTMTRQADLLLIDGDPVKLRGDWLRRAPQLVKPGGWVVLDNANRLEYVTERAGLLQYADLIKRIVGDAPNHDYCVTDFFKTKGNYENRA